MEISCQSSCDEFYIKKCFALARKALGKTYPNPPVGALIVKDGCIIGKGWHEKTGTAHAEVAAIENAREKNPNISLEDSTLYVSLEPCNHYGKTPACTNAILDNKISSVVYSVPDPNPKVKGGGGEFLKEKSVKVKGGVLENMGKQILFPWLKSLESKMPSITLIGACDIAGNRVPLEKCLKEDFLLEKFYKQFVKYSQNSFFQEDINIDIAKLLEDKRSSGVVDAVARFDDDIGQLIYEKGFFSRLVIFRTSSFIGSNSLFCNVDEQNFQLNFIKSFGNVSISIYT